MKWYDECSVMSWKIFQEKQPLSNQGIILYLSGGTEENHETRIKIAGILIDSNKAPLRHMAPESSDPTCHVCLAISCVLLKIYWIMLDLGFSQQWL
jgi:hypothetical protein